MCLLSKRFGCHIRLLSGFFSAFSSSLNVWLLYGMTWSPGQVSQNRSSNWVGCILNLINSCCLGHLDLLFWAEWFTLPLSSLQDEKLGPKTSELKGLQETLYHVTIIMEGGTAETTFWVATHQVTANSLKWRARLLECAILNFYSWSQRWIRPALLSAPCTAETFQYGAEEWTEMNDRLPG